MSRFSLRLPALPVLLALGQTAGAATTPAFQAIWRLGENNGNPNEFGSPTWNSNAAPGSPTARDDDYYRPGTYPGFGEVAGEPLTNLQRGVVSNDPRTRIHFPLTAAQASSSSRLKLTVDLLWGGSSAVGFGTHDIAITMNGRPVGSYPAITWNRTLEVTFPASSVNAVAGANVIQIERTGGITGGTISFDYLQLDHDLTGMADADSDGLPLWYEEAFGLSDSDPTDAAADPDGDGRTTLQEFIAGTNPTNADTDNDGISDSAEIALGTNPLLRDTDGDGIPDGDETTTSPLLADTDGDGYPDNIEIEQGTNPNSVASKPFDFPGAIGLQFIAESHQAAVLPSGDPAGYFRFPHWNASPPLSQWQSDGIVLTGSQTGLKNHRGQATAVAANWSYHFANPGLHKGVSDERLFSGMLRTQRTGTINSNNVATTVINTPASVTLTGIPYATYDLLVYAGYIYPGSRAVVSRQGDAASSRYLISASEPPFRGFKEVTSTTTPQSGNYVRYRNLGGANQTITLTSLPPLPPAPGNGGAVVTNNYGSYAGIHGIQIIDTGTDTDGDGIKDAIEVEHRLNPAVPDATADADGDGLSNAAELATGTDLHHPDSDRDGIPDGADAAPLNPDRDGDGLLDGDEVNGSPFPSLPDDADSDNDGYDDADERAAGSDPMSASSVPAPAPTWNADTRTWTWRIDNLRVIWNHPQSMLGALDGSDTMLCEAVAQVHQGSSNKSVGIGLRYRDGRVTYRFRCIEGLFRVAEIPDNPSKADAGFWGSDWANPPADRSRDFGFSGVGTMDDTKPLRMQFTATRPDPAVNAWTLNFLIADLTNPASPVPIATQTWSGAQAMEPTILSGTTVWSNSAGKTARVNIVSETGVKTYISPTPLGIADTDNDGMPDAWEATHSFNINSAADAAQDADNDGLSNLKEYLVGTNPHNADSDGDGASDSVELLHGTDPLSAASKPAWFNFTGNIADLDGDGLSDAWVLWSGGGTRHPHADDDGDGMTNLEESEAGTDPDDPSSKLDMRSWRDGDDLVLSWTDLPLKAYDIESSPTLAGWQSATGLPASAIVGGRRQLTIPAASLPADRNYYRASITPKDSDGDGVEDWVEAMVLGSSSSSTNSLSQPLVRANGQTLSGDALALLDKIQGASPTGRMPGSSAPATPSPVNASRFLMQSTFGPTPDDITKVRLLGYAGWIEEQLALPATYHTPYIREVKRDAAGAHIDHTYNYNELDKFLFGNNATTPFARAAIAGEDQLRQRVAFALSQILVVSRRDANLEEKPEAITNYYDTLLRHALGDYGDLLLEIAMHPAMGAYLSHAGNQKADPSIPRYPDENFARELMQLFTIGLWELNADGSRKLDSQGEPIPTYDNGHITEFARVFTGLYYDSPYGWGGGGWADDHFTKPMVMHADRHDFDSKKLLHGFVVPPREVTEGNGLQDVRDAVDSLFRHPNTPPFVSRQLIQFLVTDNPTPAYIRRVQDVFVNDGSGKRGNLGAVVKAILLDPEAREQPLSPGFGKVREPVVKTMHLGRLFKLADTHPDFVWWNWTDTYYGYSKQEPMNSPSVFNFYTPVYQAPGEIRNAGLLSPGFQIVDTYSSISYPNLMWEYLRRGFRSSYEWWYPLDYSATLLLAENPAALVDHVNLLVCSGSMTARTRAALLTAISQPNIAPKERVALAVWTAMTCPEGSIQR
ncbi:DUF1800 family protein [Luteolibacter flavescens]|uniref:DUF1800 family protein n=1 Tax=Luteolibacter flavescens TaxID=1859460 RepID=A0ABT3FLA4_9BACT|nr:DUF1800 family protein [Luteolibacter flavescens]MCW1884349.1 DUF1800 family protein [Luteolibacter flavescens]